MSGERDIRTARARRRTAVVALVAVAMGAVYASVELASSDWDPAGVISVGVEDPPRVAYAEALFDRSIPLSEGLGHDGRFFVIQAMDPLLLAPHDHARFLDRPTYRAQRMFYPLLAGSVAPFGPEPVAWALIVVNVLAFGIGTWATARLAAAFGLSEWWGLAFALNPGVRFELDIDGAGVVAMAALMVALWAVRDHRKTLAITALVVAVLGREVMLLAVFGLAIARGAGDTRDRLRLVGFPLAAVAAWWLYVDVRLGDLAGGPRVEEIGLPFDGFLGALDLWRLEPGRDLVLGIAYLLLAALALLRAIRRRGILEMPMLGFALLATLLTRQVWFQHFDISRALAPLPTLLILSLAVSIFARPPGRPTSPTSPVSSGAA